MRRLSTQLVVLAGLLLGLLSITGPTDAADPFVGAPATGDCFDLTADQVYRPSIKVDPVACSEEHTATIIEVAKLPHGVAYHPNRVSFSKVVLATCYPAADETLGTTTKQRRTTAFATGFFIPTKPQRDAGARWFACAVFLQAGSDFAPVPTDLHIGAPPYSDDVARCLTSAGNNTVCAREHAFDSAVALWTKGTYPSVPAWFRKADRRCPTVTSTRRYTFDWPSRTSWDLGDRFLVCFSRS